MKHWTEKLFIERSDLFLKVMNERWERTEDLVNGMVKILNTYGIASGNVLDLCCGNGRVSVYMAKKGFRVVGVDMSEPFLADANKKAREHRVADRVTFLEGDVRKLKEVVGKIAEPFDMVVSVWTSIGFFSRQDDLRTFKQARELSRDSAILFLADTMHSEYLSLKFTPTSYADFGDVVLLENRSYDVTTSQVSTTWSFYKKLGENLMFVDKIDLKHHIYSVSELSSLLRKSGWEPVNFYGNLSTLQPMNSLTGMDIVAKAC